MATLARVGNSPTKELCESGVILLSLLARNSDDDHLSTAEVGPATVPKLAAALDDKARWVLLPDYTPIHDEWQEAVFPLTLERALLPTPVTVRRVRADVLLETAAFLELAPELVGFGCRIRQFRKRPPANVDYDKLRPQKRAVRYKADKLTVSIDLPQANGPATIAATDEEALNAALIRLGIALT